MTAAPAAPAAPPPPRRPDYRWAPGLPMLLGMAEDELAEVEENIRILMAEELEVQHWLEGHGEMIPACPVCRSHTPRAA